jgi:hypothetical protein
MILIEGTLGKYVALRYHPRIDFLGASRWLLRESRLESEG